MNRYAILFWYLVPWAAIALILAGLLTSNYWAVAAGIALGAAWVFFGLATGGIEL